MLNRAHSRPWLARSLHGGAPTLDGALEGGGTRAFGHGPDLGLDVPGLGFC